ncbi:MAG: TonB-dependent receptor [Acidobacteriia bacterium]|nr:TonB-dependent receptor [Terriglobia bacterium]
MPYRHWGVAFLIFILVAIAPAARAQQSQDDRIKALEERIIALEGQVRMLKAQQQPAAPAPATPEVAAAPVASAAGQAGALPVYGGASAAAKALNPDISVIGDFLGSMGHNPMLPTPAFQMHESEVGLQAIIDPYARGDFFLSFGEEGVNLEEGYITLTALPAGFVVRGGKMRAAFGKVNTLHNHVLPWADRPLVTNSLVGGEDGIDDAGLSVTRILPAPKGLFLEATGQVFRGDSADVFSSSQRSDVSAIAHLRGYRDLTESTNLDIGASYARGHNDLGSRFLTQLYGVDATLRWKPLRRSIYHSFVGRGEFIWSQRQQLPRLQRSFGFYTSGDYQLGRRWFAGARYDRSDRSRDDALTDSGASLVLTYWPSEFSQLRGQYRLTRYAEHFDAHEFLMQLQFSLGAHGAHPF